MARRFLSWSERPLRALAKAGGGVRVAGRLQAAHPLEVAELPESGASRTAAGRFELLGPGDVVRLSPQVITRRYPAPGAPDAEETKAALVELEPADLPWRYSPEIPRDHAVPVQGEGLRPWLVLVVGTREAGELAFSPDGRVGLGPAIQQAHPLAESWRWAHVHEVPRDGGTRLIGRILCPRDLAERTDYTACLVPAFVLEGGDVRDAWPKPGGGTAWLPCYDSWSFRTGEEGDFPQLASRLEVAEFGPDSDFGLAQVRYRRRRAGEPSEDLLPTPGALQRTSGADPPPVEDWIADEVGALTGAEETFDGRWVLTSPRYSEPFTEPDAQQLADGWARELATDPRRRGSAGLGAWAAIAWQDRIAEAAAERAGDLAIVRDRVNHVTLGVEASRALWRRHVPRDDPVAALAVLGSVVRRLPALSPSGRLRTPILILAGRTPLFASALWSSAARRALRPGPARTSLAQPDAADFAKALEVAGGCPEPAPDPAELPLNREGDIEAGMQEWEGLERDDVDQLRDLVGDLGELAPARCDPVGIGHLGVVVTGAVDPTVPRPLVVDTVLGDLDDLGPVELEPELDLPLWSFLADNQPDWLLPGIGALEPHRVVGLATNPGFVEAMLAGANHQATGELRFRNLPLRPRWSPLRKFWQRAAGELDIEPIKSWPASSPLGGAGLQPPDLGAEAVVFFRTPLFKRYPDTVVYLYDAGQPANWTAPAANVALADNLKRFPTFTGRIGDDSVFFGFPIAPEALAHHWLVLEEPPTGYRFYLEDPKTGQTPMPEGVGAKSAAEYGLATFAVPVRVMIADLLGAAS